MSPWPKLATSKSNRAHFTKDFTIVIQIWWNFHFALIQILIQGSPQTLAHDTATMLCNVHVQISGVISWLSVELQWNNFSIKSKQQPKIICEMAVFPVTAQYAG